MNAQNIPFPKTDARSAARLFAFEGPPTVEDLLERARMVENLYKSAQTAHKSGAGWLTPPGRLHGLRR